MHPHSGRCSSCGADIVTESARFCWNCGAFLADPADGPSPLTDLGGERKVATILFADIHGSLGFVRGVDPETARARLRPVLEAVTAAVRRFDGTLCSVLGDGVMAVFGAPVAQEDHAARACCAALSMLEEVERLARRGGGAAGGTTPRIRVGLASGEVVVGAIATGSSVEYAATGEAVHLASRLEQAAPTGMAYAAPATVRLAEGVVTARRLDAVPIKGTPEPVEAYEVLRVDQRRSHLDVAIERGLTPFANRGGELALLAATLARASEGAGETVVVRGEAGAGKSRLLYEFLHSAPARGCRLLAARCTPGGARGGGSAGLPGLSASHFGVTDRDDPDDIRAKIAGRLAAGSDALRRAEPAFLVLHGIGEADAGWRALEPQERRRRLLDAVWALVEDEASRGMLILTVEDIHWADQDLRDALDRVAAEIARHRILLLATCRAEHRDPFGERPGVTRLDLPTLAGEDGHAFLRGLFGDDSEVGRLAPALLERTHGNAFFLEETARSLVERGVLVGAPGAYRLASPAAAATIETPPTVRSLLAARIDRLGPRDRRMLRTAAVIGRDFAVPVLEAVSGDAPETVRGAIRSLQETGLIHQTSFFPDQIFSFRHALTHEATYAGALLADRRAIHARVVAALERHHAGRLKEHEATLAHHAVRGELWDKAAHYARNAGTRAADRSANSEAVHLFELALEALRHLPEDREVLLATVDIRFALRDPLYRLGEIRAVQRHLSEAGPLVAGCGDPRRQGQLAVFLSHVHWLSGDQQAALAAGMDAINLAGAHGDPALTTRASFQIGLCHLALGAYAQAVEAMRDHLASARRGPEQDRYGIDPALQVVALNYLARALAEQGDLTAAWEAAAESGVIAMRVGKPFSRIFHQVAVGYVLRCQGRPGEAIPWLAGAVEACTEAEAHLMTPVALSFLGAAHTEAGDPGAGLPLLRTAVASAEGMGFLFQQALRQVLLGQAELALGQAEAAGATAATALDTARRTGDRGAEAHARCLLAAIALARGDAAAARLQIGMAATLARRLGMRPLIARCALVRRAASPARTGGTEPGPSRTGAG